MAKKQLPMAEATVAQLRTFAELHLGISVAGTSNRATTLAAMAAAWDRDYIEIDEDAQVVVKRGASAATSSTPEQTERDQRLIKLLIPVQEGPGGKDHVPLGVNGIVQLVPRGYPVEIRWPYFEVLARSVQTLYDQDKEHNMIPRLVPHFPYTVISGITEEEHKALRPPLPAAFKPQAA
jgi:hypothetical protein